VSTHPSRFEREPGAQGDGPPGPRETRWTWLLLVPLIGTLVPTIYNTKDPELAGVPFFYWYQMLWIPLSVLCTVLVYRATRRRR
jgi:Protein of unknown function (DUF3311)